MNKMKKVLMTMFGLVMLPLLFACSNNQSAGIEAIKSKGKLVVALNPEKPTLPYQMFLRQMNGARCLTFPFPTILQKINSLSKNLT